MLSDRAMLESFIAAVDVGDCPPPAVMQEFAGRFREVLNGTRRADRLLKLKRTGRPQIIAWPYLAGWFYWLREQPDLSLESDEALRSLVTGVTGSSESTVRDACRLHREEGARLADEIQAEYLSDRQKFIRRLLKAHGKPIAPQEFRQSLCLDHQDGRKHDSHHQVLASNLEIITT